MKSLLDYPFLVNDVFYRCEHVLSYIESHTNMDPLEISAIKATIMDALVYKGLIDPNRQSLDLEHLCICNDVNHYCYEKHPNVCGIPQWMKEEFRKKSITITGGIPISLFLAKPPSKFLRYCVYDPNTAVSSIFNDATFYQVFYTSPTRGKRIEEVRPFVEVEIDGILYLVDTLTKRIWKSSYFKEQFGFEVVSKQNTHHLSKENQEIYQDNIKTQNELHTFLIFAVMFPDTPALAEMRYELERSKDYFPEEWIKYEQEKEEIAHFNFMPSKNE